MKADFTGPVKQGSRGLASLLMALPLLNPVAVSKPHGFRYKYGLRLPFPSLNKLALHNAEDLSIYIRHAPGDH